MNQDPGTDHDLLIELRTEMRLMRTAMDKLTDLINESLTGRVESLENWRSYIVGGLAVVTLLLAVCAWVYNSQQSVQDSRIDNLIKQVNKI